MPLKVCSIRDGEGNEVLQKPIEAKTKIDIVSLKPRLHLSRQDLYLKIQNVLANEHPLGAIHHDPLVFTLLSQLLYSICPLLSWPSLPLQNSNPF